MWGLLILGALCAAALLGRLEDDRGVVGGILYPRPLGEEPRGFLAAFLTGLDQQVGCVGATRVFDSVSAAMTAFAHAGRTDQAT